MDNFTTRLYEQGPGKDPINFARDIAMISLKTLNTDAPASKLHALPSILKPMYEDFIKKLTANRDVRVKELVTESDLDRLITYLEENGRFTSEQAPEVAKSILSALASNTIDQWKDSQIQSSEKNGPDTSSRRGGGGKISR